MKIEVRADNTIHIEGYVNAVERESRPVITKYGRVNELIEQRTFEKALSKAENIPMTVDHIRSREIANTKDGSLKLYEDNIGLRAVADITDEDVVEAGRTGKIVGWSFGMQDVTDELEERAEKLPLRRINGLTLDHVTLVINKTPYYSATSVEVRADNKELEMEERALETNINLTVEMSKEKIDYSNFENRLKELKK